MPFSETNSINITHNVQPEVEKKGGKKINQYLPPTDIKLNPFSLII